MNPTASRFLKRLPKTAPLLLLLLPFFPVACRQPPPYPPRVGESTVLMNPSAPPCWYDICPDETTKAGAMLILAGIPEVDRDSIVDQYHENARSFVAWHFRPGVAEGAGRFYYWDQRISHFYFYTENILNFGEAIEVFGEPTFVLPFSTCRWLYIALIYPDDGLYLVYFDSRSWQPGSRVELTPGQSVGNVIFYNPAEFEELITRIEGANWVSYSYDDILQIMQSWQGFGEIEVYDPCRPQP